MTIDIHRRHGRPVAEDELHCRQVGAGLEQQRRRRVAEIVEAQEPRARDEPELEPALWALGLVLGRRRRVDVGLVATVAPAALEGEAFEDAGAGESAPQNVLRSEAAAAE